MCVFSLRSSHRDVAPGAEPASDCRRCSGMGAALSTSARAHRRVQRSPWPLVKCAVAHWSSDQAATIDVATDDHSWAKPLIEEALAALERGEGRPLNEVAARMRERIAARS